MTQIQDFNAMLNWKLLKGSHDFPGPSGGTCINEAAIVAAGFKYQKVDSVLDMPPCFSRVICSYALTLNDRMPENIRTEKLAPFITRLAGTADTPEVEKERAKYLVWQAIKVFAPNALIAIGLQKEAEALTAAKDLYAAAAAAYAARAAFGDASGAAAAAARAAAAAAAYAARAAAAAAAAYAARAAAAAAYAARAASGDASGAAADWGHAIAAFEGVLEIGNQADPIETALINERVTKALELA